MWLHTHPGNCPQPSLTDEETFDRVFGRADWAVMFILAREGQTHARLRFNVGPGGATELLVEVDYRRPFTGCDFEAWEQEYLAKVQPEETAQTVSKGSPHELALPLEVERDNEWFDEWSEYVDDADDRLVKGFTNE